MRNRITLALALALCAAPGCAMDGAIVLTPVPRHHHVVRGCGALPPPLPSTQHHPAPPPPVVYSTPAPAPEPTPILDALPAPPEVVPPDRPTPLRPTTRWKPATAGVAL